GAAEVEAPVASAQRAAIGLAEEARRLQPILDGEVAHGLALQIERREAAAVRDPKHVAVVDQQRRDQIARESVLLAMMFEARGPAIVATESSVARADPEVVTRVLDDRRNGTAADVGRGVAAVAEPLERVAIARKAPEAVFAADPHDAFGVFDDRPAARGAGRIVRILAHGLAVPRRDAAVARREPDHAVAAL